MEVQTYQACVAQLGMPFKSYETGDQVSWILHGAIGLSTEAGELLDIMKRALAYSADIDPTHIKEELGDALFYIQMVADAVRADLPSIMAANIAKLEKRYPGLTFRAERALTRDLNAERAALEENL